jgi:hypothetical protein
MTKTEFLILLGQAYNFPDYYTANLDSADEILGDLEVAAESPRLPLKPFFEVLLAEASPAEREDILDLLGDYFGV